MTVEEKACCLRIVDHYGVEPQEGMMIEECSELITALRHKARGRATVDEIIEELADVIIMAQQLAIVYGQSKVESKITEKLQRQIERIGKEKPQPKADVVTVVRCRNCAYYDKRTATNIDGLERCFCDVADNFVKATDFCSDAVQKEAD